MSFSYFLIEHRDCTAHREISAPRVMETKKQKTAENVTTTPTLLVGKKRIHLSSLMANVPGPLPESLRKGVYEAYGQLSYGAFMRHTVALQEGTLTLEEVDAYVFSLLGFEGGKMNRDPGYPPSRDASSKSHRPDLYRMFVAWSTAQPSVVKTEKKIVEFKFGAIDIPTVSPMNVGQFGNEAGGSDVIGLDSLEKSKLDRDLKLVDAEIQMCLKNIRDCCISETMKEELRKEGNIRSSFFYSLYAWRTDWKKEFLKRAQAKKTPQAPRE